MLYSWFRALLSNPPLLCLSSMRLIFKYISVNLNGVVFTVSCECVADSFWRVGRYVVCVCVCVCVCVLFVLFCFVLFLWEICFWCRQEKSCLTLCSPLAAAEVVAVHV